MSPCKLNLSIIVCPVAYFFVMCCSWSLDYALCTRLLHGMASYCGRHQVQEAAWKEAYCPLCMWACARSRAWLWGILLIHSGALAALCCYHISVTCCLLVCFLSFLSPVPYLFFFLVLLHVIISCSWLCRYVERVASQTFLCLILMWSPAAGL